MYINRYKKEAASFRHKRKQKTVGIVKSQPFSLYKSFFRLKTYGFLRIIKFLFAIAPSSLTVSIYAYRSSSDDFCSKSSRLQIAFALRIPRETSFSPFSMKKSINNAEFLMTQPLLSFFTVTHGPPLNLFEKCDECRRDKGEKEKRKGKGVKYLFLRGCAQVLPFRNR